MDKRWNKIQKCALPIVLVFLLIFAPLKLQQWNKSKFTPRGTLAIVVLLWQSSPHCKVSQFLAISGACCFPKAVFFFFFVRCFFPLKTCWMLPTKSFAAVSWFFVCHYKASACMRMCGSVQGRRRHTLLEHCSEPPALNVGWLNQMTAAFHHRVGIGMWGKCFVLIFHMCLGVSGFRLFKNRLSSLSVAESCGGDLKEILSISRSV